jgi:hypothetical protein
VHALCSSGMRSAHRACALLIMHALCSSGMRSATLLIVHALCSLCIVLWLLPDARHIRGCPVGLVDEGMAD